MAWHASGPLQSRIVKVVTKMSHTAPSPSWTVQIEQEDECVNGPMRFFSEWLSFQSPHQFYVLLALPLWVYPSSIASCLCRDLVRTGPMKCHIFVCRRYSRLGFPLDISCCYGACVLTARNFHSPTPRIQPNSKEVRRVRQKYCCRECKHQLQWHRYRDVDTIYRLRSCNVDLQTPHIQPNTCVHGFWDIEITTSLKNIRGFLNHGRYDLVYRLPFLLTSPLRTKHQKY